MTMPKPILSDGNNLNESPTPSPSLATVPDCHGILPPEGKIAWMSESGEIWLRPYENRKPYQRVLLLAVADDFEPEDVAGAATSELEDGPVALALYQAHRGLKDLCMLVRKITNDNEFRHHATRIAREAGCDFRSGILRDGAAAKTVNTQGSEEQGGGGK